MITFLKSLFIPSTQKIKYEVIDRFSITDCPNKEKGPYGWDRKVGSVGCKSCKRFGGIDGDTRIVVCKTGVK